MRRHNGAKVAVDVGDYIGQRICQNGAFEPLSLALAEQIMSDGGWFLDVGCNFGLYSFSVGALRGVKIIAVDPSPSALAQFNENQALNPGTYCVSVNAALSDTVGLVEFKVPSAQNLGTGQISAARKDCDESRTVVAAFPVAQILNLLSNPPIHLLKIDAEGSEMQVLLGWDWEAQRPLNILCEYLGHGIAGKPHALIEFLQTRGYSPYTVTGAPWTGGLELPEDNLWWKYEA